MKPRLDNVGILNDTLILNNTGHSWAAIGNGNTQFLHAVDFSSNFLYSLLPCNNNTAGITEIENVVKQYPNPANDMVYYSSVKLIKEIVIYNQIGQIKKNIIVNSTKLEMILAGFEKGIYYIKLIMEDSNFILKKLLVSK
jgi:hypothetical protein